MHDAAGQTWCFPLWQLMQRRRRTICYAGFYLDCFHFSWRIQTNSGCFHCSMTFYIFPKPFWSGLSSNSKNHSVAGKITKTNLFIWRVYYLCISDIVYQLIFILPVNLLKRRTRLYVSLYAGFTPGTFYRMRGGKFESVTATPFLIFNMWIGQKQCVIKLYASLPGALERLIEIWIHVLVMTTQTFNLICGIITNKV